MLYFHDASSLEHDPSVLSPEHPDTPDHPIRRTSLAVERLARRSAVQTRR